MVQWGKPYPHLLTLLESSMNGLVKGTKINPIQDFKCSCCCCCCCCCALVAVVGVSSYPYGAGWCPSSITLALDDEVDDDLRNISTASAGLQVVSTDNNLNNPMKIQMMCCLLFVASCLLKSRIAMPSDFKWIWIESKTNPKKELDTSTAPRQCGTRWHRSRSSLVSPTALLQPFQRLLPNWLMFLVQPDIPSNFWRLQQGWPCLITKRAAVLGLNFSQVWLLTAGFLDVGHQPSETRSLSNPIFHNWLLMWICILKRKSLGFSAEWRNLSWQRRNQRQLADHVAPIEHANGRCGNGFNLCGKNSRCELPGIMLESTTWLEGKI